jgi:hypothetical protein
VLHKDILSNISLYPSRNVKELVQFTEQKFNKVQVNNFNFIHLSNSEQSYVFIFTIQCLQEFRENQIYKYYLWSM